MNRLITHIHCSLFIVVVLTISSCSDSSSNNSDSSGQTGTAGSTARMVIDGDYLYAISGSSVQLFDITAPATPVPWTLVEIDWDIQTLFPYEDYLLVGAADGVHILDNSDRASPRYVGDFQHAITRDPVVAQDDVAYVTLQRDDTQFGTDIINQLNVIDLSDVTTPTLIQTQELQSPSGLAVRGERLYVCDGSAGLKIFDLADKFAPKVSQILANVECNDLIATDDTLHVIGPLDYSQYNTSMSIRPQLMSTIRREPVVYLVDR